MIHLTSIIHFCLSKFKNENKLEVQFLKLHFFKYNFYIIRQKLDLIFLYIRPIEN